MEQDAAHKIDITAHTEEDGSLERGVQTAERLVAGGAMRADFGDQRIVVGRDTIARRDASIYPHAIALRRTPERDLARLWEEASRRVFGIDARLDRVAAERYLLLRQWQRMPLGHQDLPADEIEASDQFGDGMLHLESRVDFEEVEGAVTVHDELDGARAGIAERASDGDGGLAHARPQFGRQRGGGRLFDHLLVAALNRTLALAQRDDMAVGIAEDLYLDMAWLNQRFFQQQRRIAEG